MKYIYHSQTGTYFPIGEAVIVDTDDRELDIYDLDNEFRYRGPEIAEKIGRPIRLADNDLTFGNTMSFSPSALREEARALLDSGAITFLADEDPVAGLCKWMLAASDDQLNQVAEIALQADGLWDLFQETWIESAEAVRSELSMRVE